MTFSCSVRGPPGKEKRVPLFLKSFEGISFNESTGEFFETNFLSGTYVIKVTAEDKDMIQNLIPLNLKSPLITSIDHQNSEILKVRRSKKIKKFEIDASDISKTTLSSKVKLPDQDIDFQTIN